MTARRVFIGLVAVVLLSLALRAGFRYGDLIQARRAYDGRQGPSDPPVRISPDYRDLVIPPNIAPLNFTILKPGSRYYAAAFALESGSWAEAVSDRPQMRLPPRAWKAVLEEARSAGRVTLVVGAKQLDGEWDWSSSTNGVSPDPIDAYLVYRRIPPLFNFWEGIEIRERCLATSRERCVLSNYSVGRACVNCHAFRQNHTDYMALGTRGGVGTATFLSRPGALEKLGTKFGYTAWHPNGKVVAYSCNEVRQFFHWAGQEIRDVVDLDSGLAYYDLRTQTAATAPALDEMDRLETYPTWSPDGRFLYFCSAAIPWRHRNQMPPENYRQCRYDLRRVSYDPEGNRWGQPETVLTAAATGKSLLLPRVSPDGRFLLFCLCDYGCFPIFQPSSDLGLLDLKMGAWRKLGEVNSDRSESWHSWSSNGRWVAFSSKRHDGLFTRTYLTHVDEQGRFSKPFVMPQSDPAYYDSCLTTYSVPELVAEPVRVSSRRIAGTISSLQAMKVREPIDFKARAREASRATGTDADAPWRPGGQ
jgi:hypothetical protein